MTLGLVENLSLLSSNTPFAEVRWTRARVRGVGAKNLDVVSKFMLAYYNSRTYSTLLGGRGGAAVIQISFPLTCMPGVPLTWEVLLSNPYRN